MGPTANAGDRPHDAYIRLPDVLKLTGLSRSTIYALIQRSSFPAPVKLTAHASGWRAREVHAWLANPARWLPEAANDNIGGEV